MGAKVDKNENIVIGNQLDDIIEYQGYEEFHIEKINNALTQQKPKIKPNPSLNNHSGGSSIGKYESDHAMNKENYKNQEDNKEKNNEEENIKLKQAQKPPEEPNKQEEAKNGNNEENINNAIENNNNEQKLENTEKKDEDNRNDKNAENNVEQVKENPIEEQKNNDNNAEKEQNNDIEEKDKDKDIDKAKEEENEKTNNLNEQEATKDAEKEKDKEKQKEDQNEIKNENVNVNVNNDKNNDIGNNETNTGNANNDVTEQNKEDINKDKNEEQENTNINNNNANVNNDNNNEEGKKIENENENKNDEFAPKKIILPTIDTIISQKVLEEGAGNELLFMSNLNKIVHISIKERVKYAEKFCITTKDNFLIYETRENYIKVKKPLAIIPINYIKNVVLFKLTKKVINYDHFYIEFQLNENMRNNVYNQIDTFYINDLDNTNNENKNDTALVMFKTEEKNLAKKWYVLLKYLAELKSKN